MAFFGNRNTGGSSVATPPANNKAASKFTLDIPGTVDHITFVFATVGTSPTAKAVIYSDNAGAPDALIATSDQVIPTTGIVAFPFSTQPTLAAGDYWIGIICNVQNTSSCAALTNGIKYNSNTYASGPSNPFGSVTNANFVYPVNVCFTPTLVPGTYLGELLGGDTSSSFGSNRVAVIRVTAPSAGTISAITFYATQANASAKVKGVIYDATGSGGAPGALLGTTPELAGVAINRNVVTFSSPVSVSSGTLYIGILLETAFSTYTRSVANCGFNDARTYSSGPANPYGTATASSALPAFWATFTSTARRRQPSILG